MQELKKRVAVSKTEGVDAQIFYLTQEIKKYKDENGWDLMDLKKEVVNCHLETLSAAAEYPSEVEKDIFVLHNIDIQSMLNSSLSEEVDNMINRKIYNKMATLGDQAYEETWTNWERKFNKWFDYKPKIKITTPNELAIRIIAQSKKILSKNRVRPADFIIIGSGLYETIANMDSFIYSSDKSTRTSQFEYIGNIADKISVIINRELDYPNLGILMGADTLNANEGIYLIEGDSSTENIAYNKPETLETIKKVKFFKRIGVVSTNNANLNYFFFNLTKEKHNILTHLISLVWKKLK